MGLIYDRNLWKASLISLKSVKGNFLQWIMSNIISLWKLKEMTGFET